MFAISNLITTEMINKAISRIIRSTFQQEMQMDHHSKLEAERLAREEAEREIERLTQEKEQARREHLEMERLAKEEAEREVERLKREKIQR